MLIILESFISVLLKSFLCIRSKFSWLWFSLRNVWFVMKRNKSAVQQRCHSQRLVYPNGLRGRLISENEERIIESFFEQTNANDAMNYCFDYTNTKNKGCSNLNTMITSYMDATAPCNQEGQGIAIVEGLSASQRLANFFTRPFRSNRLKRTKSASKFNRRNCVQCNYSSHTSRQCSHECISALGLSVYPAAISSRHIDEIYENNDLRSARSHESLFAYPKTTATIDLADFSSNPQNPSDSDVPYCFKIAKNYYTCRTNNDDVRCLDSFYRKASLTNRSRMRRRENSLQTWILEAKGIPSKRKYYCEICLNKTLYARTSAKPRLDMCFWGEFFEFGAVPNLDIVCINLYREADPKKKKDRSTLIGYVQIRVNEITTRHPIERWYTVTASSDGNKTSGNLKDRGEQTAIRVKARYQSVDILPLHMYDELLRFLRYRYLPLCMELEPLLGVKAKEDFATSLVRIMHNQRLIKDFLCDLIMAEFETLENEHLMFRGNSLATKAMEAYMKLTAEDYLKETLGEFVRTLFDSENSFEVDPLKMPNVSTSTLEKNRLHLIYNVEIAWSKIMKSAAYFPVELREIFDSLRRRLAQTNRKDLTDTLISSSIFLRFLCPAILSPSLFNLVPEYPSGNYARNLTLIAKTLQTLANFTKFGGKEHYMEFMNDFVSREWNNMHYYLMQISTVPSCAEQRSLNNVYFDLGRDISLLHSYLCEVWNSQVHEHNVQDSQIEDLSAILNRISALLNYDSHASSMNGNVPNNSCLLIDGVNPNRLNRGIVASHLGTADDYVVDTAIINDSLAVRQAGMCVQQHRIGNSQLKSGRHSISRPWQDHSPVRLEEDFLPSKLTWISRKLPAADNGYVHADSDSDELPSKSKQPRPCRKNKRRTAGDQAESMIPVHSTTNTSSGYQSQDHSNSLTSSNSSSPIDSASITAENHGYSRSALQISNPVYNTSSDVSSKQSSLTEDIDSQMKHRYFDAIPSCSNFSNCIYIENTCESNPKCSSINSEGNRCSLPRTNPRVTARSQRPIAFQSDSLKPSLVDISQAVCVSQADLNNPSVVTVSPSKLDRNLNGLNANTNVALCWSECDNAKSASGVEGHEEISEKLQLRQQEIIEMQKREILRLMRENEKLRKHVSISKPGPQSVSTMCSEALDSHPFADSGASEDGYDSFSFVSEYPLNSICNPSCQE